MSVRNTPYTHLYTPEYHHVLYISTEDIIRLEIRSAQAPENIVLLIRLNAISIDVFQ